MDDGNVRVEPAPAPAPVLVGTAEAPPEPWSEPYPDRPLPFWSSLRQDLRSTVPSDGPPRSAFRWTLDILHLVILTPGIKVVFFYRVTHTLSHRFGPLGWALSVIIKWLVHHLWFSSISPRARLYGGLCLPHPQGLLIGPGVVVGPQAWIFHNVTIGPAAGNPQPPRIGARSAIYVGAVVSGAITIGDDVMVCPNSFVQRNIPSRTMAVGVPANLFPKRIAAKP
jgi:serine O-acetyltransferase